MQIVSYAFAKATHMFSSKITELDIVLTRTVFLAKECAQYWLTA